MVENELAVYETTAYTVLVPHGLVGKFYPDGGSRYAVAVASVAACSDDCDKEENENVACSFHFNMFSMSSISDGERDKLSTACKLFFNWSRLRAPIITLPISLRRSIQAIANCDMLCPLCSAIGRRRATLAILSGVTSDCFK